MVKLFIGIAVVVVVIITAAVLPRSGQENGPTPSPSQEVMEKSSPSPTEEVMMEKPSPSPSGEMMKKEEGMMLKFSGTVIAGTAAPLLDYNKADFEAALKSDKLVVLYFYANWCPICKVEVESALYPAFNELTTKNVVGFQVSYNDSQTDNDERELARAHGVAYQHTKVFLRNGQRVLKSPESWNKARYHAEIQAFLK